MTNNRLFKGEHERLWYNRPAAGWNEALPVGNGALGAMVFGRVRQERLQLNEDTLWSGGPYRNDNPRAREAVPEVRRLLTAGDYAGAHALAERSVMGVPLLNMAYGSLGDLFVEHLALAAPSPTDYRRELDLTTAVARTAWSDHGGPIRATTFASQPDQVLVHRIEVGGSGRLELELRYRAPRAAHYVDPGDPEPATPAQPGPVDWDQREDPGPLPADVHVDLDGPTGLLITGPNAEGEVRRPAQADFGHIGPRPDRSAPDHVSAQNVPAALTWALSVQVVTDGEVRATPTGLTIHRARTVTLVLAAATSFVAYDDVSGDPVDLARDRSARAAATPYPQLLQTHVADHRRLYDRFALDLGTTPAADRPTDTRVRTGEESDDPALAALYVQYARYLMIASSRPGTQPANLQGIWNEGTNPPWGSKWTININTEMNYWFAGPAGLGECVEPLLRLVEDLAVTGARTARDMYGARGWVCHHNTDLWRATAPVDGPAWGLWPTGGAWLAVTLWQQWLVDEDPEQLVRLLPLLRDAATFFLDTLVDVDGRLVTSPSLSPENAHPAGFSIVEGPAMDRQIVHDLLDAAVAAGDRLGDHPGVDADLRDAFVTTAARIAPDLIGAGGQLQEWLADDDEAAPEQDHRHVSHLYAVYPGGRINVRDTPELIAAAKVSLDRRGDYATGWGTAWRACLWTRMGEAERAHRVLRGLLGARRTYPNLFDAHPPFQIDGNFGGAAAIMEMLVQSWGGELRLLPALPAAWPAGSVRGLRANGGLIVDLSWRDGRVTAASITGRPGASVRVVAADRTTDVLLDAAGRTTLDP